MEAKIKNWLAYALQLQFFLALTIITIFLEFAWLFDDISEPSAQKIIFSLFFISFIFINLSIASFSMYAFIFIFHVLDKNPIKTAPVCPLALDCALVNIFLCHFSLYKVHYFIYFAPFLPLSVFYHIPFLISQISEILLVIALFTICINLQFGINGIFKRRIKTNKTTDFIHSLLILNGLIGIIFLHVYLSILTITFLGFIISIVITLILIGLFNFTLRRRSLLYPIAALTRWRELKENAKTDKGEI